MSEDDLNKLKKRRTLLRTSVTRTLTELQDELPKAEVENVLVLEEVVETLVSHYEALKNVDIQLEKLFKPAEFETEFSKSEEYREKVVRGKFRAMKKIQELKSNAIPSGIDSSNSNQNSLDHPSLKELKSIDSNVRVKLPKLTINKFYGNITNWLTFWNSFESAIHNNESLDKVDKFNYLKAHLGGSALYTVEGLPITASAYDSAIDLLKERFAKNDLLIHTHMNNFLNIKPLHTSKDVYAFRKFYDKVLIELRNLENLGQSLKDLSSVLCTTILKALPHDILIEINVSVNDDAYSDINKLLKVLSQSLYSRERAELIKSPREFTDKTSPNPRQQTFTHLNRRQPPDRFIGSKMSSYAKNHKNETSAFSTSDLVYTDVKEKIKEICAFCDDAIHRSEYCPFAETLTNDERVLILRKKGICFRCLQKKGHVSKECKAKVICSRCGFRHVDIMCTKMIKSQNKKVDTEHVKEIENKALANQNKDSEVYLQTLIVGVSGKDTKGFLRLLIDTGSQNTYLSKHAAKSLKLEKIRTEKIKHGLFGGVEMTETHNRYRLNLNGLDGKCNYEIEALDQEKICTSVPRVKDEIFVRELRKKGIYISDIPQNGDRCFYEENPEEIHLLIGADTAAHLFTERVEHFPGLDIAAFETKLGWTLMGKLRNETSSLDSSLSVLSLSLHVSDAKLSDLWRLDSIGILDEGSNTKNILEEETQKYFLETVEREESGRYVVNLPWIVDNSILPSNQAIAEKSLFKTKNKLIKSSKSVEYEEIFKYWEDNCIIEIVTQEKEQGVHYLPHRPVIKDSSETTKIRPVFNASAHSKNSPSLNDCLAKGPNLIEIIPRILSRFRKYRIGISSDIEKAFCQIKITEKDRDFLRFFWLDTENNLKVYRHNRVVFGLTSSPFLLAATLNHLLNSSSENYEETSGILKESFYIDNSLVSLNNIEEAEKFSYESKMILASAQFNLRSWRANIPIKMIEDEKNKPEVVSVLGLEWDLEKDSLSCKIEEPVIKDGSFTKRKILSITQKIFDPIGFTAPITLIPKMILQETWVQKIKWDEELTTTLSKQFRSWVSQLPLLSKIEIPRWLNVDYENEGSIMLHVFSDASKRSYATCVFIRVKTRKGIKIQLVNAKSRVAPIKEMTIPRLELLSCLIGARLAKTVKGDLKLEKCATVFWSDSSTALGWIRRDNAWGTFVHNRVQEIRSLTEISEWRHVPGNLNPADLPSRGCSVAQLQKSKWWEGPSWLYQPENDWPRSEELPDEELLNKEKRKTILTLLDKEVKSDWYYHYFSSYKKIVRMLAWIFRFFYNLKNTQKNLSLNISVDEFAKAERTLCKIIQKESFTGIQDPSIRALRPIEDKDGIFRAKTQVVARNDKEDFCYPVILPASHPVVQRMIQETHVEKMHAGVSLLMAHIRERFWILKSRKSIRNVIKGCVRCRRYNVSRVEVQPGIPPEDRVREGRVFEVVGVDLAGPLNLSDSSKSWIVLYTCAIYRAIHLELVTSLSTETFIQSLRRFIARRGRPYVIYSDNGTNFIGTNRAVAKVNWEKISGEASTQRIRWKFNPPTASWWGGWWERLVRMVKEILRKVLGRSSLNYEELNTILCDCEQVINSRPITYVSEDLRDPSPLTPQMFLQELPSSGVPDIDAVDSKMLSRRAKYRQTVRENLRSRFRSEYLGQLRQVARKETAPKLCVGDVVLIEDFNRRRVHWPLAKIVELLPGRDNVVRLAKVKTGNGTFLRPIPRLFPLEISSTDINNFPFPDKFISRDPVSARDPISARDPVSARDPISARDPVSARDPETVPGTGATQTPEPVLEEDSVLSPEQVPEVAGIRTRAGRLVKPRKDFFYDD